MAKPRLTGTEALIYQILQKEKQAKPTDLVKKTDLSPRSVRNTLKKLQKRDLVSRRPDLLDLRSHYYYLKEMEI